jgi:hypothetical protein
MHARIVAVSLVFVCPVASTWAQKSDEQGLQQSRFAAELAYRQITEENVRLNTEIGQINAFLPHVENAQKCVAQAKLDPRIVEPVAELRRSVDEIRKLPGATQIGYRTAALQRLNNAISNLYSLMGNPLYDCVRSVIPQFRNPGQISAEPVIDVIRDAAAALRTDGRYDLFQNRLNALLEFSRPGPSEETRTRSDLRKEELARVDGEIALLTKEGLNQIFEEQRALHIKSVEQIAARGRTELDGRNAKLKDNQRRLTELDKALTEKQAAQTALDRGLLWAVYGMIFALTILFLSLRLFKLELATQLVKDRSLVEMVSMAFILLTIIILGTGEKIGKETIGTLLGTIAGYIFARKIAEEGKEKDRQPPQGGRPDSPANKATGTETPGGKVP